MVLRYCFHAPKTTFSLNTWCDLVEFTSCLLLTKLALLVSRLKMSFPAFCKCLKQSESSFISYVYQIDLCYMINYDLFTQFVWNNVIIMLQRKAKGENLLEKVCDHINLLERDYFGLTYEDKNDPRNWVELDKRIGKFIKSKKYFVNKLNINTLKKYSKTFV